MPHTTTAAALDRSKVTAKGCCVHNTSFKTSNHTRQKVSKLSIKLDVWNARNTGWLVGV